MPATKLSVDTAAQEPQHWPNGVPGSRTVAVELTDDDVPGATASFLFGALPDMPMELLSFGVTRKPEGRLLVVRDLPLTRWERAARAEAERSLVTTGPHGQHVSEESTARSMVDARFPELRDASGGNALRRRNALVHLAEIAQEYKRAEAAGARNPAQIIADHHAVTSSTVRGWMHRARREGLAAESPHPNAASRVPRPNTP